jgi:hypothetical protein
MTLKAIPQQEFQKCFQHWQHRWTESIAAQGKYSEGEPFQYAVNYTGMLAINPFRDLHSHIYIYTRHIYAKIEGKSYRIWQFFNKSVILK